jgi:hypothetical protein
MSPGGLIDAVDAATVGGSNRCQSRTRLTCRTGPLASTACESEDRRRDHAGVRTAGPAEEAAQEHDPTRQRTLAGTRPDRPELPGQQDQSEVVRRHRARHDEGKLYLDSVLDMGHAGSAGSRWTPITTPSWPARRWRWPSESGGGKEAIAGGHHALRQGSEYTAKTFRAPRDRMGANNIDMPRQSPTREPNAGAVVLAALHRETERSTQPAISAVRQGIQ